MDIIMYLIQFIQYQHKQICWLLNFICRYIPLKQWAFDDSRSPKYQKFKIDKLPVIKPFIRQDWKILLTSFYQLDDEARKEVVETIQFKLQYHRDPERAEQIKQIKVW